jgi:hypothetical protein
MSSKHKPTIGGEIAINLILLYASYNELYFDNKLPKEVPVFWGSVDSLGADLMGTCFYTAPAIVILNGLKEFPCIAQITLLHEMCHLEFPKAHHGKKFKMRMRKLAKQGAFDTLW